MNDKIYLYTENLFFYSKVKSAIKRLLGRESRGPQTLFVSLIAGLRELGQEFVVNKQLSQPINVACVISGVKTLQWAIQQKKRGLIKKIIAGPTIAMPLGANGIIFDPAIDVYISPSAWAADFCDTFQPGFKSKIRIWPAGVETLPSGLPWQQRQGCLLYQKNVDKKLINEVRSLLESRKIQYNVIKYGEYRREEYYKLLKQARFMVALSQSESQGIALNEAWMLGTPTIVWNGGFLKQGPYEYKDSSPAPYLNSQTGLFFDTIPQLNEAINKLETITDLDPRAYHLKNFTEKISATKFVEIVHSQQE